MVCLINILKLVSHSHYEKHRKRVIKCEKLSLECGIKPQSHKATKHYWYLSFSNMVFEYSKDGRHILRTSAVEVFNNNDQFVIEQYTGLKDKNGNKIFEGDILRTRNGKIQEVVSVIGSFDGTNMTSQFTCFFAGWQNMNPSDVKGWYFSKIDEVIGNIHENPELLNIRKEVK